MQNNHISAWTLFHFPTCHSYGNFLGSYNITALHELAIERIFLVIDQILLLIVSFSILKKTVFQSSFLS